MLYSMLCVYIYIYSAMSTLEVIQTFRIKMIVFPRYKIPWHHEFHHQPKIT